MKHFLLLLPFLAGCGQLRFEEIPTGELSGTFEEITSLKAYARVSIGGFRQSGGFDAQILWSAPGNLRVRTSHFEFTAFEDRFQLWMPDEERFITGSVEDFRKSDHGELYHLFKAVLPARPRFIAYIKRGPWNFGLTREAVYRFRHTTPVDRKNSTLVQYDEMRDGIPIRLVVRQGKKFLRLKLIKTTRNKEIPEDRFTMSPPEGAKQEEFRP